MNRLEIRITGFGGQGVVLLAYIVGRAAAINAGKHATMIQSFGPEARGSACSATLVVSDNEVLYPYIRRPDILVVMSGEAYQTYKNELKDDGLLVYEKDLVPVTPKSGQKAYGVPSTRIAEGLGKRIAQNIVMLGFVAAATRILDRERMREAVRASVPSGTEDFNVKAFDAGYAYFAESYGEEHESVEERAPVALG